MRAFAAVALAATLLLGACAYPDTNVQQGAASSGLYFTAAAAGTRVFIDGSDAGDATLYNGKQAVLVVPPGPHQVTLKVGQTVLYDKPVFVGAGSQIEIKGQ